MHSLHSSHSLHPLHPSFADVTVKSTGTGKGMGMGGTMTTTTYIKGNKMRTDTVTGDTTRTMIFDVDAQRCIPSTRRRRKPTRGTCRRSAPTCRRASTPSSMKASVKPNGQTKQIAGKTATGYDMEIDVAGHDGRHRAA